MLNPVKLLITSERFGGKPRYSFYVEKEGLFVNAGFTELPEDEIKFIADSTRDTQNRLKKVMIEMTSNLAVPTSFDEYVMDLGGIGTRHIAYIPPQVQECIRLLPDDPVPYVYIYAENHWIPWELIYDKDEQFFWGEKCIIVRIPMLTYTPKQTERSVLKSNPKPIRSVVNIVGDQVIDAANPPDPAQLALDNLAKSSNNFSCNYHNSKWEPRTVVDVRNEGEKASILHFTCHGRFDKDDGYYLQLYSTPAHASLYRLSDLKVQSHLRLDDALVFVNACTSDVPTLNLGTIINLGELFFKSGADVFIGTIAPVPIPQAVRLADIFYKYLLQGMSVGISLHKAKMDMKAEKNPFYLFYCLYGNAYKRFRRVNQA